MLFEQTGSCCLMLNSIRLYELLMYMHVDRHDHLTIFTQIDN